MATSIGIEIGASSVRAVRLQREGAHVQLQASMEAPVRGQADGDLSAALAHVRETLGIRQSVILGVPTSSAMVTTVEPLIVQRARAWLAVQFELQQQLPYDVQQAAWDDQAWGDSRSVVLAMKQSVLLSYVAACTRAGLSVEAVSIGGVAALNAWARSEGDQSPAECRNRQGSGRAGGTFSQVTALLHAEAQMLEWIVVGPRGVQIIPLALPESPQPTGPALVEWLKGSWESVRESLGQDPPPTRVWVLGEAAAHPNLGDALAQACGCAVDVVDPTHVVDLGSNRPASPERLLNACGLALQGLGQAALAVNLLTQTRHRRRLRRARRAAYVVGTVCVAVIISCCASAMWALWHSRQAALQAVLAQEQLYTRLRPEAQALLKQQRHLEERLQHLTQLIETHAVLAAAFRQIADALPDEIWLTKLEISRTGRMEAMVEGYAKSFQGMNRLMEQLKATGSWASVKPIATAVTTDATTNQQLIAFTVQAQQ